MEPNKLGKYHTDPIYRQKVLAAAKERYRKKHPKPNREPLEILETYTEDELTDEIADLGGFYIDRPECETTLKALKLLPTESQNKVTLKVTTIPHASLVDLVRVIKRDGKLVIATDEKAKE